MTILTPKQKLEHENKAAVDRVKAICRFAKPGDQIPLPWDIWEDYSRALPSAMNVATFGDGHPLRLPVEIPEAEASQQIILTAEKYDKSHLPVTVFPVIK